MKRWDLTALPPSSRKETERAPGADASRVPREGSQAPRVLCSYPECRIVELELPGGQELGEHQVRQRAVLQVVDGRVEIDCAGETVESAAGTLVTFDPGEHHAVRALADSRLLLILAPWSADEHVPANAVVDPI